MSGSNWSFKDNLTIDNSKYLKWQGTSSIQNVIGLDSNNDLNINSGGRDMYINSSSANSVTYINEANASPVLIGTNMSIGLTTTAWNQAGSSAPTLCLSNSTTPYIGTASSGGLGLAAGASFDTSSGSLILLDKSVNIHTSNNTAGNVNVYTGNDSLKFQILGSGTTNIIPDGTTIALSVAQNSTTLSTPLRITNTAESYSPTTGAIQVAGGIGIKGNTYIDGTLSINSVTGNINFNSSTPSTSYSSGTIFFTGGLGIECSVPAVNQYSGGGISCAGGLALGQNAMVGGNVTVLDSSSSLDSQSGSIIAYGGVGINGQTNIRSQVSPQIRIAPVSSGAESSIYFSSQNNYSSTGSWKIGQNTGSIGTGNFAFVNASNGNFISFNESSAFITLHKQIIANDTLTFTTNGNLIKFNDLFSIGSSSGNFLISRTGGNSALSIQLTTGNVRVFSTENSTTAYSGAVVISGGTGIAKDLYVGGDIFSNGTVNLGGGASISPGGASTFSYLTITASDPSDNIVNGSLVTFGGISIQCTDNSTSPSSGNGLTVAGGVGIYKDLYIGGTSYLPVINSSVSNLTTVVSTNISSVNLIVSNATFGSTIFTNANLDDLQATRITSAELLITGLASVGNLIANVSTINNAVITNTSTSTLNATGITSSNVLVTGLISTNNLTVSSSTLGNAVITNASTGTLNVTGTVKSSSILVTGLISTFTLSATASTLNSALITNTSTSTLNVTGITSTNLLLTNGTMSNLIIANATVTNGSISNIITTSSRALNGSISNLITSSFTGSNVVTTNATVSNLITDTIVSYNTVDFKSTANSTSITQGGNLTVLGGASIFKDLYIGGNIIGEQTGATLNNLYIGSADNSLGVGSGGSVTISGGASITNDLYIGGNLGIGNTTTIPPQQMIEASPIDYSSNQDGGIRVSTKDPISVIDPSYRYIDLRLQSDPTSNFRGIIVGSLAGGIAAEQEYIGFSQDNSTYIYSEAKFTDGTSCSNSSTASVVLSGGLSINCFTNATTVSNGGALTVAGGVAIAGDLIIGGSITYSNAAQASNTYAYLTLTASDPSDNLANGALVTFGGVSIQCTNNATSSTSGGGLTVAGGAAIGSDLYVENNIYSKGTSTYYANTASNLINFYDQSNIERFSMDLNLSNNAYEISRYGPLGFVETAINISNVSGMTTFNNTSPSTNSGNGTLSVAGGIGIQSTKDAVQLGNGGGLTVSGGASIGKKVFIGGDTIFSSTTVSNGYTSGSIIVAGGVGVNGNLNIGGSTIISGDLTVIGTTTTLESQNTILSDNILLLNAGPAGSADAGILIQRYQQANDGSTGDVVSDMAFFNDTIPNQSGMSSSQIKLSTNASGVDNYYTGWWVKVTSGLSAGQVRQITGYIGLTRIVTLGTTFTIQNPSITDTVSLYNKPYVGVVFSQSNNRFEFGSSATDSSATVSLTDTLPIYFSSATSTSTQPSTSASIGGLLLSGGLSSTCTAGATSLTSGGSFTIAGGASIAKNMYIGTGLTVNGVNMTPNAADISSSTSFTNVLNATTADITGLVFNSNVWSIDIYLAVRIIATVNSYSNYHIRGVNKGTTWELVTNYVGDATMSFSINNSGQISYTSNTFAGFVSGTLRYKVVTN